MNHMKEAYYPVDWNRAVLRGQQMIPEGLRLVDGSERLLYFIGYVGLKEI